MKVVDVETVVVGTPWRELTFVELVTDEGLRGLGEARMVSKTDTLLACSTSWRDATSSAWTPSTSSGWPGASTGRSTAAPARSPRPRWR
jgi:L-alanine-DL-glutamate epimerase-like enolase superfamily enzyme